MGRTEGWCFIVLYSTSEYSESDYSEEVSKEDSVVTEVDLMSYLPLVLQENKTMQVIQKVNGQEIGTVKSAIADLLDQLFIETATWGLSRWEKVYGLDTDVNKNYAYRRERIKARKNSKGTVTKQMIINIASCFSGGEATVIEYPREYRFVIKFIGVKGIPGNMKDLTDTINEIKPSHLAFTYEYTYNTWDVIGIKTWKTLSNETWNSVITC